MTPATVDRVTQSMRNLRRDESLTVTPSARRFTNPGALDAERTLFAQTWLLVGRGDEIPGPGR